MASKGKGKGSSASSRPIHPAYVPTFAPLGAELSAWAYLTVPRPSASIGSSSNNTCSDDDSSASASSAQLLPNLVTAHSTTLRIYSLDPTTGRLILASTYDDLAGSVVSLEVIVGGAGDSTGGGAAAAAGGGGGGAALGGSPSAGSPMYDALLLGFGGEPRLSVVYPPTVLSDGDSRGGGGWSGVLTASSIVDLTPAMIDACRGGRGAAEIDLVCCVGGGGTPAGGGSSRGGDDTSSVSAAPTTTAAVILGGGVAVAAFDLTRSPRPSSSASIATTSSGSLGWWRTATEPYVLPLSTLSTALNPEPTASGGVIASSNPRGRRYAAGHNPNAPKISHGFGDILDCQYLRGYTEPVLLLLHSNPNRLGGRAWSGRLATPSAAGGTRHPLTLTAISVSVPQRRSVVLWSLRDALPADSFKLISHPVDGVLVVGANEILYVDGGGRLRCGVASNGFARATCPSGLVPAKIKDNAASSSSAAATTSGSAAVVTGNPSPLPLLSLALDGCRISFVSDDVAALCIRDGSVYSLEIHRRAGFSAGSVRVAHSVSLSPMNCKLGGMGMVSTLSALPLATLGGNVISDLASKIGGEEEGDKKYHHDGTKLGLLFAGSRLGDSTLLLYGMRERVPLVEPESEDQKTGAGKRKRGQDKDDGESGSDQDNKKREAIKGEEAPSAAVTDDEDAFRMEDEALYAPPGEDELKAWGGAGRVAVIAPAEDDGVVGGTKSASTSVLTRGRRPVIESLSVFDSPVPRAIDALTGIGPLGPGTMGPTSAAGAGGRGASSTSVHPCGYGSSGGLAVLTVPGMNAPASAAAAGDSQSGTMVTEADCRDVAAVYGLSGCGLVLLGKAGGGTVVMKMVSPSSSKGASDKIKKEEEEGNQAASSEAESLSSVQIVEVGLDELTGEDTTTEAMDVEGDDGGRSIIGDDATLASILKSAELLQATEWNPLQKNSERYIVLFLASKNHYAMAILSAPVASEEESIIASGSIKLVQTFEVQPPSAPASGDAAIRLLSTTPLIQQSLENGQSQIAFGAVWSNGSGSVITLTKRSEEQKKKKRGRQSKKKEDVGGFDLSHITLEGTNGQNQSEGQTDDDEDAELEKYYASNDITAIDVFEASRNLFKAPPSDETTIKPTVEEADEISQKETYGAGLSKSDFDADDYELYGSSIALDSAKAKSAHVASAGAGVLGEESSRTIAPTRINPMGGSVDRVGPSTSFLAICRQSGSLEIHDLSLVDVGLESIAAPASEGHLSGSSLVWRSSGCGLGSSTLVQGAQKVPRTPRMHSVKAAEMRFSFAGPSTSSTNKSSSGDALSPMRSLCLLVETDRGDVHLYAASERGASIDFARIPTGIVGRPSKDQARHKLKLRRRGIIAGPTTEQTNIYRSNRLHRFVSISAQSGLFAGTTRPFWVVSERGAPAVVQHRARHVAPAGGKDVPVTSFCCGIAIPENGQDNGFLTLHERIGHVGSQRITVFDGLSDIFAPLGLFPGGGLCIQKIPLGVTVRHIQFIDDVGISSASKPLYAVLVSREIDVHQGRLDHDGLSPEERQKLKDEKEEARTRRQVEADLGGFDMEQEWVEEIEREDYFEVDTSLGRAPPLPKRVFELWLVDAASGWNVIDSHQLDEVEHGASMQVMTLSELLPETGTSAASSQDNFENHLFMIVGTGIIDKDGEDISAKGRILLFDVTRHTEEAVEKGEPHAEMTFVYEKDIALGPVTSLSCLSCEGKNRLVVGAGAEITIEQWTGAKLLQVGFFHVNMQVQRISLFKTFLLLSDAYDSLHFLVWRESDKSLTLLAKDYEPVVLYATGLMSRGGAMSFVCHDDRQNLQFLQYAPTDVASRGGNKLVCRADFHLGAQTTALQSHFCRSSLLVNSATPTSTLAALKQQDPLFGRIDDDQRFAVHFGSTDGGLGSLVPLSEQAYWRLTALQSVMSNALDSNCALSNRAWRLYRRNARRGGCRSNSRMKGVIDGEIVSKFSDLSLAEQEDLASAIGSTVELILDNILDLACAGMVI